MFTSSRHNHRGMTTFRAKIARDTPEEQLAIAACYIADGLQRDERCLYVAASDDSLDCFRTSLRALGVDVDATERSTALLLRTSDQAHLQDGHFDSERMLKMLNESIEKHSMTDSPASVH